MLKGTGEGIRLVPAAALPPAPPVPLVPPPAAGEDPSAGTVALPDRVVPLVDVLALEEMLLELLVDVRTVALLAAVEADERADRVLTFVFAAVLVVVALVAEVTDTGPDTPVVADGESRAFPVEGAAPEPAPDEEPAVFDDAAEDELLVEED